MSTRSPAVDLVMANSRNSEPETPKNTAVAERLQGWHHSKTAREELKDEQP